MPYHLYPIPLSHQPKLQSIFRAGIVLLCYLVFLFWHSSAVATEEQLQEVTLQLKWHHQFQFAGYYSAIEQGFYEDEGLHVILKEGGPQIKVDEEVLSGRADFGVLGSELVQKRSEGKTLVLLVVIFQHSTRAIIVRKDSSIHSPAHMIGKTIMINLNEDTEFRSMCHNEGVAYDQINIIPKDRTANQKFINGEIDGLNGSIGNQPFYFEQEGIPVRLIRPINYGTDFYGDSLFTSESEIAEDNERVQRFVRASLKGWRYAMDHVPETVDLIIEKYSTSKSREHLLFEAEAMRALILPELVELGHINPGRIERIAQIYATHGLIPKDYSLEGFIYQPNSSEQRVTTIIVVLSGLLLAFLIIGGLLSVFNARLHNLVRTRTDELRKNNSLLTSVIEGTDDAIFVKDIKGRYILANNATLRALGKRKEEVIGKSDRELFPESSADVIHSTDNDVLETGTAQLREERIETVYGDSSWLSSKVPYRDHNDKIIGLIGISRNITEIKKSEEEKLALREQLYQAQKLESIGTLAGGIAHDFNNILAAILGYSQLLAEDLAAETKSSHYVSEIIKAGNRAKSMVQQLLAFSRKSPAVQKQAVRMSDLLLEVQQLLRASIPTTIDIHLSIITPDSHILAEPTQIHQVIMNLCTNGAQAMDEEGGILTIELDEVELQKNELQAEPDIDPGRYVRIRIIDTGPGIEEHMLQRIFEPYFTTKEVGKGSGLGLSVALGIVKSHNGMITVESTPGVRTIFNIYFRPCEVSASEGQQHYEILPGGDEHILIVDDERPLVEMTQGIIERLGYSTTAMTDSRKALMVIERNPYLFDLLITDQTMPAMTGVQLVEKVRAIRADMPIILCTGYSSKINKEQAKQIGIDAFLLKPADKSLLAVTIRKVLDTV